MPPGLATNQFPAAKLFRIALLVDVIEKKFVIFDFWLVVVVANIGGCFLEFACVKNNATIADQRAS